MDSITHSATDKYIDSFPERTAAMLRQLRAIIRKAAPQAEELISYRMPAFRLHGMLVYFAGYENHIGFYPGASAIYAFKTSLAAYKYAKGSVQFPLDRPLHIYR